MKEHWKIIAAYVAVPIVLGTYGFFAQNVFWLLAAPSLAFSFGGFLVSFIIYPDDRSGNGSLLCIWGILLGFMWTLTMLCLTLMGWLPVLAAA